MTVKSIKFVEEVDNTPDSLASRGELNQGDTYDNFLIYKLTNDDGSEQFIRISVTHDSYGSAESVNGVTLTQQTTKSVTVWA